MSKANSVYALMLVIFGAGLWAILSVGSILLHAPTDISGRWAMRSDDSVPHEILVEQSGRSLRVSIDGASYSCEMTRDELRETGGQAVTLSGKMIDMNFVVHANDSDISIRRPILTNGHATRNDRTRPTQTSGDHARH